MQIHYLLQAFLISGALSARKNPRQVTLTVTAGVSAPSPIPVPATPVPWEQSNPGSIVTGVIPAPMPIPITTPSSSSSADLSLPPLSPSTASGVAANPPTGSGAAGGPDCGKGYTYCGYMLTGDGHNFNKEDVEKAYCDGLPELCTGGTHKTNIDQAVFVCMSYQPSTVQLMCACSGTCLNNSTSNYIAHCEKACVNK